MIQRKALDFLAEWSHREDRKPLIIRGARQVGKTTLVKEHSRLYKHYVYYNLEQPADQKIFADWSSVHEIVTSMCLNFNIPEDELGETLLFIDEIQASSQALNVLRFFYEHYPQLSVIASGSLLEHALQGMRVPVGRVEYMVLHPINFAEYLSALGHDMLTQALSNIPVVGPAHDLLLQHFHQYLMVGGMPEAVQAYIDRPTDIERMDRIYVSLLQGYLDDIDKYAANQTERCILRRLISSIPYYIHQRITFHKFDNTEYRSREVGSALRSLQMARIIDLIYPTSETQQPYVINTRKRPKLHFIDVGLALYVLGVKPHYSQLGRLSADTRGRMIEQVVTQEIRSMQSSPLFVSKFWVRERSDASAEVDGLYPSGSHLIPIEVKSGSVGKLRSLHQYMERCSHHYAVRFYQGPFEVHEAKTASGTSFYLMNMPYYLGTQMDRYLAWFLEKY